jgi:hypothetical protein
MWRHNTQYDDTRHNTKYPIGLIATHWSMHFLEKQSVMMLIFVVLRVVMQKSLLYWVLWWILLCWVHFYQCTCGELLLFWVTVEILSVIMPSVVRLGVVAPSMFIAWAVKAKNYGRRRSFSALIKFFFRITQASKPNKHSLRNMTIKFWKKKRKNL